MDKLKPLIDELVKVIQSGGDIVTAQMPDIAKQIVRLYLWGNVIEIPILIGLMVWGYCGFKWFEQKASTKDSNGYSNDAGFWRIGFIPIVLLEIIVGTYVYGCGQTLLKAILAPKILILEVLKGYLK